LDDSSEEVLIIDDSTYDRSRSKKVELLSRVFDHTTHKYLKGFRLLTLGWSERNSFLGVDFVLLSSAKETNRYNEINPDISRTALVLIGMPGGVGGLLSDGESYPDLFFPKITFKPKTH